MPRPLALHPDRLFPADPRTRDIARMLYGQVAALPIISPHGHTDPSWFAGDAPWANATELLLAPDHYLYRMLYSQGITLDRLAVPAHGIAPPTDPRAAWALFAANQALFRGTPSRLWLDHVFADVFGFDVALDADTADLYYDRIADQLATAILEDSDILVGEPLDGMAATQGPTDRIEFRGFEFVHAVVGGPAQGVRNRHSRCCYSDEASGIDHGIGGAFTSRSTSGAMASRFIGCGIGGVVILRREGQGDVGNLSPSATLLGPIHRECSKLIDLGFC